MDRISTIIFTPRPTDPVFFVPINLVSVLNRDLEAAGIPKTDDEGRTIDVHALRHTTGSYLAKAGVAPRVAQSFMRHSDIRLTLGIYSDPSLLNMAAALDALPSGGTAGSAKRRQAKRI